MPWRREIVRESLIFTNSEIRIPDVPRLELNEEACARHPYKRHPIQQFAEGMPFSRPEGFVPFVSGIGQAGERLCQRCLHTRSILGCYHALLLPPLDVQVNAAEPQCISPRSSPINLAQQITGKGARPDPLP